MQDYLYIFSVFLFNLSSFFLFFWTNNERFIYKLDRLPLLIMEIDDKDFAIIAALKENSRLPIRDIAKRTKLRPSTVHQRILRLKEGGVIEKFTLKLSNRAVGENFIVLMLIKTKPSAMLDKLVNNKHVREFFGITGEYDLMLKLKF